MFDPLTELHTGLARLEERLNTAIKRLEEHMEDEETDIRETLADMKELRKTVGSLEKKLDEIHIAARLSRWAVGVIAALVAWIVSSWGVITKWLS